MSSAFNYSLTVFSPSGKLVQIENALTAVEQGRPTIGMITKDGIILVSELGMQPSVLQDESTLNRINKVSGRTGMGYAGLNPDFRMLVTHARAESMRYSMKYGEDPSPLILGRLVANVMQDYTQQGGVRPFGVSLLFAGFDEEEKPHLVQCDPSGSYFAWKAVAIGKNSAIHKNFLAKRYSEELDMENAMYIILSTMKDNFEGKMTPDTLQVATITAKEGFKLASKDKIKDFLDVATL